MPSLNGTSPAALANSLTGGDGADVLNGTIAAERLNGAGGADVIRGLGGADTIDGGEGSDRIFWTVGDGSDVVDGGGAGDTQFLTGAATADTFVISATGSHVLINANGGETLDLTGVEQIQLDPMAGADNIQVRDLNATEIRTLVVDLGVAGADADTVSLTGVATDDQITAQIFSATSLRILDSANGVTVTSVISSLDSKDRVTVAGGGGADTISITSPAGVAAPAPVTARGNEGADTLTGSIGADILMGDAGADVIKSGGGSDTIDGGADADLQIIGGSDAVDVVTLSASGGHVVESVAGSTLDVTRVETLSIRTLGQADTIRLGDLSSAGVRAVNIDLSASNGAADGQADTVILAAPSPGGEVRFTSPADGSSVEATYLLNGSATEVVTVSAMDSGDSVRLAGGDNADAFFTTAFSSTIRVAVDGGLGANTENFTGTAGDDRITLKANANHAELTLNGSAPLDMVNIQSVTIKPLAGKDTVDVGDLRTTDVRSVNIDLAGASGLPDGQADTVNLTFASDGPMVLTGLPFGSGLSNLSFTASSGLGGVAGPTTNATILNVEAGDAVNIHLEATDRYVFEGQFGHAAITTGAIADNILWTIREIHQSHDTVDGGAGFDRLDIGLSSSEAARDTTNWNISLFANAGRSQLSLHHLVPGNTSDPLPSVIDSTLELVSVERLGFVAGGGSDFIGVFDQSGGSVQVVDIDVGGGRSDGARDFVVLDGSAGNNTVLVSSVGSTLNISGLPGLALVRNLDGSDHTFIRAGAGGDTIDLTAFRGSSCGEVNVDGGAGDDTMVAGSGLASFDFIGGGGDAAGHDVLLGFVPHARGGLQIIEVLNTGDHSFQQMVDNHHIFRLGPDVAIQDASGASLLLLGVAFDQLSAADFLF